MKLFTTGNQDIRYPNNILYTSISIFPSILHFTPRHKTQIHFIFLWLKVTMLVKVSQFTVYTFEISDVIAMKGNMI